MRRRVIHFLVTVESLAALGGIIAGGAGVSAWLVLVPEVVWVALFCSVPVVLGFIPWGLRLRASRQRQQHVPLTAMDEARQRSNQADANFRTFMYDLNTALARMLTPAAYRKDASDAHETKKDSAPDA